MIFLLDSFFIFRIINTVVIIACGLYAYRRWGYPALTHRINQERVERHDAMMRYRDIQRKIHTVHDQCAQQDLLCAQLREKVSQWCSQMAVQRATYRADYDRRCAMFAQREEIIIAEQIKYNAYSTAVNSIVQMVERQVRDQSVSPDVRAQYTARAVERLCRR